MELGPSSSSLCPARRRGGVGLLVPPRARPLVLAFWWRGEERRSSSRPWMRGLETQIRSNPSPKFGWGGSCLPPRQLSSPRGMVWARASRGGDAPAAPPEDAHAQKASSQGFTSPLHQEGAPLPRRDFFLGGGHEGTAPFLLAAGSRAQWSPEPLRELSCCAPQPTLSPPAAAALRWGTLPCCPPPGEHPSAPSDAELGWREGGNRVPELATDGWRQLADTCPSSPPLSCPFPFFPARFVRFPNARGEAGGSPCALPRAEGAGR